jgi:hypothetical protein
MLEDAKNLTKPFVYIPSPNSWRTAYGMAWYDLGNGVMDTVFINVIIVKNIIWKKN